MAEYTELLAIRRLRARVKELETIVAGYRRKLQLVEARNRTLQLELEKLRPPARPISIGIARQLDDGPDAA